MQSNPIQSNPSSMLILRAIGLKTSPHQSFSASLTLLPHLQFYEFLSLLDQRAMLT